MPGTLYTLFAVLISEKLTTELRELHLIKLVIFPERDHLIGQRQFLVQ